MLSPAELAEYQVHGYGGSDMTPALLTLAEDPRVTSAIVITDGEITYPLSTLPYAVLWAVPGEIHHLRAPLRPRRQHAPRYNRIEPDIDHPP